MASHGQLGFQASEGLGRTLSKPTSSLTATASSGSRLNDVYISELLSYSLERLRKVSMCSWACAELDDPAILLVDNQALQVTK